MDGSAADERIRLQLLGCFRLQNRAGPIDVSTTGQRLLALLALNGPTKRSSVAGTLWPEVTEARAHGNLRTAFWRLPRAGHSLIETHLDTLSLATTVTVD